jgi:hypothetical protein
VYWPVDFSVNPLLSLLSTVLLFCGAPLIELCTVLLFWWGWKTLLTTTLTYVHMYFYFLVKFIILYSHNCPLKISRIKKFTFISCKYLDTSVGLSLPSITLRSQSKSANHTCLLPWLLFWQQSEDNVADDHHPSAHNNNFSTCQQLKRKRSTNVTYLTSRPPPPTMICLTISSSAEDIYAPTFLQGKRSYDKGMYVTNIARYFH